MALDRGTLSRIDRRVLAELAHTGGVQAVKVPVSDAVWSTWRRYCEAIGVSMGEGVAGLIAHELETVVGDEGDASDVFAEQVARQAEERASRLDARERNSIHALNNCGTRRCTLRHGSTGSVPSECLVRQIAR